MKSFVSRGIAEWQSAYGPKSLDAKLFEDGARTLGDIVADGTALGFVGEIELADH